MLLPVNRNILYKDEKLSIQILSQELARTTEQDVPYFVISITPKNCSDADLKKSKNKTSVLRLKFDDVESGKNALTDDQALEIKNFVLENLQKGIHSCIIHCTMGMSRSAGIGAALSKVINGDDSLFFKYYMPNMRCYRKVFNAFED